MMEHNHQEISQGEKENKYNTKPTNKNLSL